MRRPIVVLVAALGIFGCDSDGGLVLQAVETPLVVQSAGGQSGTSDPEALNPGGEPIASEPEPEPEPPAQPFAPENPTAADITDLVLITGQSNALGSGTAYDSVLDSSNARSFAFTEDGWQVADLHQVWDRGWFPRTNPGTEPSNNFSLHFGKRLAERDPARVVGFILITAPGKPISHWATDGAFFNETRDRVSNAISQLPSKSSVDGILWHQGESDGRDDDRHSAALYELIENFRSESWFGYDRPFICGETAVLPVNEQLRKLNQDGNPWTACIEAEELETLGDSAHFSAEALRIIGDRYAAKYFQMTR